MLKNLPVKNPTPDSKEFIDILIGAKKCKRVPMVEYIVNDPVMKPILTELLGISWVEAGNDRETQKKQLENFIEFWHRMGYDAVRFEMGLPFISNWLETDDPGTKEKRSWIDEHKAAIRSWEDFEKYPWPRIEEYDFFPFEYINKKLPEGMGLLTSHAGGIFEHVCAIMTLEGLSFALYDNPELVKAVTEKLGELMLGFYRHLLDLDRVIALFPGDDMGFRTGCLISPEQLRRYFLPWHKLFARMAHDRGIPYFLHSCGNVKDIMGDLIGDVEIDGKHSFEDAIIRAEDFQGLYGDKIAVLGGMDVDILASGSEEAIRKRTRKLIETCGARGSFAIGSGNSIPGYVPLENYLAMVDEALGCNKMSRSEIG